MIKPKKGITKLKGDFFTMNADMICICKSLRKYCEAIGRPELFDEMIAFVVEMSAKTDEEIAKESQEIRRKHQEALEKIKKCEGDNDGIQ